MADKLVPSRDDTSVIERYKDMGDGSWAKVSGAAAAAGAAGYPAGATPVNASSGGVANATATATLPGVAGKTTYVTGIEITGAGATAAGTLAAAITGTLGGAISYAVNPQAGVNIPLQPVTVNFNPPIPASAVNTAIVLSVPALGAGNPLCIANIHGFQL